MVLECNVVKLKKLISNEKSTRYIADEFSVSQTTVMRWLLQYGLKTKQKMRGPGKATKKKYCENCGLELKGLKKKNKCCSHSCAQDMIYKEYILRWKNGKESGYIKNDGISAHIRRYLFTVHDGKCQKCGWSKINEHTGKIPLTVNHIDGNYMNNDPFNLELICPNCHSLTSTYGNLNKGNGRKKRKQQRL